MYNLRDNTAEVAVRREDLSPDFDIAADDSSPRAVGSPLVSTSSLGTRFPGEVGSRSRRQTCRSSLPPALWKPPNCKAHRVGIGKPEAPHDIAWKVISGSL